MTVPKSSGVVLLGLTEQREAGYGQRGFGASEQRVCLGGSCWRRWEPRAAAKDYGADYESWEWDGERAGCVHVWLPADLECRATRIDWAMDFEVPAGLTSDVLERQIRAHYTRARLVDGVAGARGSRTRYVGAVTSDRRVRIYRKDLQPKAEPGATPRLRVELVLRREIAAVAWALLRADREAGAAACRTHVEQMTGLVLGSLGPLPKVVIAGASNDVGSKVLRLLEQYGDLLEVLRRLGVDWNQITRERWELAKRNRMQEARMRRRLEDWAAVESESLMVELRLAWERGRVPG